MTVDIGSFISDIDIFVETCTVVNKGILKPKLNLITSILIKYPSILKLNPMIFKLNLSIFFNQLTVDRETADLSAVEIKEQVIGVGSDMEVYFYVSAVEIFVLWHCDL